MRMAIRGVIKLLLLRRTRSPQSLSQLIFSSALPKTLTCRRWSKPNRSFSSPKLWTYSLFAIAFCPYKRRWWWNRCHIFWATRRMSSFRFWTDWRYCFFLASLFSSLFYQWCFRGQSNQRRWRVYLLLMMFHWECHDCVCNQQSSKRHYRQCLRVRNLQRFSVHWWS